MATKKHIELKEFTIEELVNELKETETQFHKMKMDHALKGLDNPILLREVRRDIARLKTEARRREVEAMAPADISRRSKIRFRRK